MDYDYAQQFEEIFGNVNEPTVKWFYTSMTPRQKEAFSAIAATIMEYKDAIHILNTYQKDTFRFMLYKFIENPYKFNVKQEEKHLTLEEVMEEIHRIRDEILTTVKKEIKPMYSETPLRVQVDAMHYLKEFRRDLKELLPPSRELSLALTKIEEAELWIGKVQVGDETNER